MKQTNFTQRRGYLFERLNLVNRFNPIYRSSSYRLSTKYHFSTKSCMILLLFLTFASPFLLGSVLYLCRDAFKLTSNAQGEIFKPRLAKDLLNITTDEFLGKWQLLYLSPALCDENCLDKTKLLENLCLALGKDKERVVLRKLSLESLESSQVSKHFPLTIGSVVIIDPKGWLVTHYNPTRFHAKGILEDLRRLMRYSYVG